jgi:hypothetical protein
MKDWKEAAERSKIARVPWKLVLGKSLTAYLRDNKFETNEQLLRDILLMSKVAKEQGYLQGWSMIDIASNLRISLSARRAEQKIYEQ